jgi:plastocyanin
MNGCATKDYMDMSTGAANDRMIMINASGQLGMPCISIKAGQAVMFMWELSKYPLAPGLAPEHATDPASMTPTPITPTSSGQSATLTFKTAGRYAFHVSGHAGMDGVIEVK